MTIFDSLKDIISKKTNSLNENPEFKSSWSSFMITRYLSMDQSLFNISEKANKYQCTLSNDQMYKYLSKKIPQRRNSYIQYISKK